MKLRFLLAALAAVLAMTGPSASALPPGEPDGSLVWTPGQPVADRDVTFGVSARDPDGAIMSVRVDFGDGTHANLATPPRSTLKDASACAFGDQFYGTVKHRYTTPGVYQARVTVVAGSCPLAGALQEASWVKSYELRVITSSAAPGEQVATPIGGLSGING